MNSLTTPAYTKPKHASWRPVPSSTATLSYSAGTSTTGTTSAPAPWLATPCGLVISTGATGRPQHHWQRFRSAVGGRPVTISANSLRWDGAPPTGGSTSTCRRRRLPCVTGEDTPPCIPVTGSLREMSSAHHPGSCDPVAPAANGGRQVALFDVIGEPAEVFGDYEGVGMSFKGNYSWSDKVPEWDEVR